MASGLLGLDDPYPLENGVWWVDDAGNFHPAGDMDDSFDAIFMRHLGKVRLAVTPDGVSVKWDTACVIEDALAAVTYRLAECRADFSVSLEFCLRGWASDFDLSPSQAIERIWRVQAVRDVVILYSTQIQEMPISETTTASPVIKDGFDVWWRSAGRFDQISNDTLAQYLPKVTIYRPDREERDIVFSWVGSKTLAMQVYGPEWASVALGHPFNQPRGAEKENYVDRISVAYEEVWATGEPRYQFVRSLTFRSGVEPEWLHYARLLTRSILHDGTPALVCLSAPVCNIPVPLPGAP